VPSRRGVLEPLLVAPGIAECGIPPLTEFPRVILEGADRKRVASGLLGSALATMV